MRTLRSRPLMGEWAVGIRPPMASPLEVVQSKPAAWLFAAVCVSLFLDSALLTAVVPILPDELRRWGSNGTRPLGMLLASKAFIELLANPFAGAWTARLGSRYLLAVGDAVLLFSSSLFAVGGSFGVLLAARALHGIGSSCLKISGLASLAAAFRGTERNRKLAWALAAGALGVVVGYPLGGVLSDWCGTAAVPLALLAALCALATGFSGTLARVVKVNEFEMTHGRPGLLLALLRDPYVLLASGTVGLSAVTVAVLEACLPSWLRKTLRPSRWQLGTVFLPDSVGYLLGTTAFGRLAGEATRWRMVLLATSLVTVSVLMIPEVRSVKYLVGPHLALGLGIGVADVCLMPLLALRLESRQLGSYGAVYAVVETAVSLAYCFGGARAWRNRDECV
ncbi:synaptic vesicular amine transporter-like [Dermacentor andersoni]|uniref:synaptic vesicular amine transporter-like n=1 Tax=Dermacentor andersoni TaxID=34620 RepID=UPI003B3A0CBC